MALHPIPIPARSWSISMFTSGLPLKVALPRDESAPFPTAVFPGFQVPAQFSSFIRDLLCRGVGHRLLWSQQLRRDCVAFAGVWG